MERINLNIFKEIYKISLQNQSNKELYIGSLSLKDVENILKDKDADFINDFCMALFESAHEIGGNNL